MKTKRWLTILMGLGLSLSVKAQEYKEGLIYDLVGNVKDMKLNTKNKFLKKHVKFQKNGKCKMSITFFDDNGLPLGYSLANGNFGLGQTVKYDSSFRVDSIITTTSYDKGTVQTTANYYEGSSPADTKIVRAVFEFKSKDGIQLIECEYSDYEYDAMGNWISRQVTQFQPETPDDKKLYTETRTLKYF